MPQQWPPQWEVNWGSSQYEPHYTSQVPHHAPPGLLQSARLRKRGHFSAFRRSAAMPHQHPATPRVSPEMDTELSRLPNEPKARIDDECGADESTHESSTCIEEAMNNQLPWDDIIWEPPMKKQRTSDDIIWEPPLKKQRTSDDIIWEPPMETEGTSDDVAVKQEHPTNVANKNVLVKDTGGGFFGFSQARGNPQPPWVTSLLVGQVFPRPPFVVCQSIYIYIFPAIGSSRPVRQLG